MNELPINQIIQGDCLTVLSSFPAASVDMVLTSPPYDNLREYKGYTFNFEGIAKELYRVVKDGGVVVWVVNDATINGSETGTSFKQALYFKEIGFNLHDTMIYETSKPPMNDKRYQACFEYMFVLSKGQPNVFNPIKVKSLNGGKKVSGTYYNKDGTMKKRSGADRPVDEYRIKDSIWRIVERQANGHPATFPNQLSRDHILSWSNEGDIILDPMCGSGTTCVAAKELKRNFIGIEIAPEYVNLARERIKNMPVKLL
jgi:DNA modification methylase